MLSPNYPHARSPPPVRPSRSLEGLERVIPPTLMSPYPTTSAITMGYSSSMLYKPHYSPTRSDLFLNKPLPARPLADAPPDVPEYSAMWSDSSDDESDSDSELTVDGSTVGDPSEPRNSTESFPIFVSSGSDDYGDLVDHPAPADPERISLGLAPLRSSSPPTIAVESHARTDSVESLVESVNASSEPESEYELAHNPTTKRSDAQYGRLSQWSQNRTGTNHYFREKKWDFFPELATPSAAQAAGGRTSPALASRSGESRKKDGRLNVSSKSRRWHSLDRPGLGLASGVRHSIKTYVHRTLSRDSTDAKAREAPRPSTAPVEQLEADMAFHRPADITVAPHSDINVQLRTLSMSTASTASEMPPSPASPRSARSFQPRPKQLAVPMSNYQKYGPAIWESPKKAKKKASRNQMYFGTRSTPTSPTSGQFSIANPTPPLSPPLKLQLQNGSREALRVIQGGSSQVLVKLDGAKKKMSESKDERRREQLKAQIKLIGPVNPHTYMQSNPWV
ncbi:hypothetical protein PMG11_06038 [Penicillium brasilianum]|uniref:Uncharacterized protein n=1 Tax=Penicillium brasilianum TaxID=104259 RepID=A0A0F7TQS6_PENBI|nr:hypothetical protein PMG11_06038 [Penicillium brasilianum]